MKRQGFTLVEMLVAMALTMFIMVILSQAFITGLDTFSQLKGIGDMEEELRVVTSNLRADLTLDHFEAKRRLSDATFLSTLPRQGFFRIYQQTQSYSEGNDLDPFGPVSYGLDPAKLSAPNHILHFTIKMRGNRREDFLTAAVPAGSPLFTNTNYFGQPGDSLYQSGTMFGSQWGEVAYFAVANGKTTDSGTPLYNLYRAQFVVAPRNDAVNAAQIPGPVGPYNNIACNAYIDSVTKKQSLYFYSPGDLARQPKAPSTIPPSPGTTVQSRTFRPAAPSLRGATLLTTNVVHFTVQAMFSGATDFTDLDPTDNPKNFPASYDTTTGSVTYSSGTVTPAQIIALQIIIRVWDPKTQQARQITVVQDM
jgi:prepilin-type N-terminal cleavage/methylation domain-containing protein